MVVFISWCRVKDIVFCLLLLGCQINNLPYMRTKPSQQVIDSSHSVFRNVLLPINTEREETWGPVVVLDILEVIKFCRVQNKPLIIGTTTEEMFVIKATNENISTTDIIITLLATRTKDIIPILFQCPPSLSPHDANMVSKMATDVLFTCATRNVSQTLALQGRHYLWVYVWDHPFLSSSLWGAYHRSGKNVCHDTDVAFLFHFSHHGTKTFDNSSDDNTLSCQIVKLWTAFIWTGNPGKIGRGQLEKNGFITTPI